MRGFVLKVMIIGTLTAIACSQESAKSQSRNGPASETTSGEVTSSAKGSSTMKAFAQNIEHLTEENTNFRRVLYTAKHSQLVVMALAPAEEIGVEVHDVDQFFRVEEGTADLVLDGSRTSIGPGSGLVVPAGTKHNIVNTGTTSLKLYTIYSPPLHRDGVTHRTRADAEKDEEHFDGKTTE